MFISNSLALSDSYKLNIENNIYARLDIVNNYFENKLNEKTQILNMLYLHYINKSNQYNI